MSSDTPNLAEDPYGRRFYARHMRKQFEQFKRTAEFKSWYNIQLRAQNHKCAWCVVDLRSDGVRIHVDHVQPLYYDGKNIIENLVLSCARCNIQKWINDRYVYPQWIIDNKAEYRLHRMRRRQAKQMRELQETEYQEQLGQALRWVMDE